MITVSYTAEEIAMKFVYYLQNAFQYESLILCHRKVIYSLSEMQIRQMYEFQLLPPFFSYRHSPASRQLPQSGFRA